MKHSLQLQEPQLNAVLVHINLIGRTKEWLESIQRRRLLILADKG